MRPVSLSRDPEPDVSSLTCNQVHSPPPQTFEPNQFPPLPSLCPSFPNLEKPLPPVDSPPVDPNPWSKPMSQGAKPPKKFHLRYIPPVPRGSDMVGVCMANAIVSELQILDNTVIGFFLGTRPNFSFVRTSLQKQWKLCGSVSVLQLLNGGLAFRFTDIVDRDMVLEVGMYFIGGQPIFLQPWERNIHTSGILGLKKVPLWVTLPGLPLHLWGEESLSATCSVLGRPMFTDQITASKSRWAFARACVEFSGNKPLLDSVTIEDDDGNIFHQPVKYSWRPPQCLLCGVFGHTEKDCQSSSHPAQDGNREAYAPPKNNPVVSHGETVEKSIDGMMNSDEPDVSNIVKPRETTENEDLEMEHPTNGSDSGLKGRKINASQSVSSLLQFRRSKPALHGWNPSRVKKKSNAGLNPTRSPSLLSHLNRSDSGLTLGRVSGPGDGCSDPACSSVDCNPSEPGQSMSVSHFRVPNSNLSDPAPLDPPLTNSFSILESDVDSYLSDQPDGPSLPHKPPCPSLGNGSDRDSIPDRPSCSSPPLNQPGLAKTSPQASHSCSDKTSPCTSSLQHGNAISPPNPDLPLSAPRSSSIGRTLYPSKSSIGSRTMQSMFLRSKTPPRKIFKPTPPPQ